MITRRNLLAGAGGAGAAASAAPGGLEIGMHQATLWKCDSDLRQDFEAISAAGFRHIEVLLRKVDAQSKYSLADVKQMLVDNNLTPLGSQLAPSLGFPDDRLAGRFAAFERNLDRTKDLGLKISNCACIIRQPKVTMDHFKQAVENYRKAAEMAKPYGIVIVIEFLQFSTFLSTLPSALWMIRQVRHPNLKVCLDSFHLWAGRGKMQDLDDLEPNEVINFHIDDIEASKPRELLGDPDRVMPGDGHIPLIQMLRKLKEKQYAGKVMLELFSPYWWGKPAEEVCRVGRRKVEAVLAAV